MRLSRRWSYAGLGAVLSIGAPVGYLGLQAIFGGTSPGMTLAYLALGTAAAFSAFGAYLGSIVEQLALANQQLTALASIDALTGLRNPRLFHEVLAVECSRSARDRQPLSMIMIDLDRFKAVNDRHGHAIGDAALAHLGALLRRTVRAGDVPCRIGGEEFAVICARTSPEVARDMAERIRRELESTPVKGVPELSITASFGVGSGVAVSPEALFSASDKALYASKQAGRNRVSFQPV